LGETSEKGKLGKGLKAGLVITLVLLVVSLFANIYLLNQVKILKDVELREISFENHIDHYLDASQLPAPGLPNIWPWVSVIRVSGTIVNVGTDDSHVTKLIVRMYDNSSQLLKSEEIDLGTIGGRSHVNLNETIEYVSYLTWVSNVTTFLFHS
jgi:hypothetical protein